MAEPLCAECSRPILSTDTTWTIEQVDACTRAVERVVYHSRCRDRKAAAKSVDSPTP